jgi:hypothetical protein
LAGISFASSKLNYVENKGDVFSMAKLKNVEKKIWEMEGFDVKFIINGKNVRGDKEGVPQWSGQRQSKNNMTIKDWKNKFSKQYPGYEVEVVDGDGNSTPGQTTLGTLRDTYNED